MTPLGAGPMQASRDAPPGWGDRGLLPCQSEGFARAMGTLGYTPRFLWRGGQGALALLRGALPGVGRLIGRANLFAPPGDRDFVAAALAVLAREGIPFVKVGDTMWGLTWSTLPPGWPFPHTRLISRHTLALDLTLDLAALLKRQETAVRTSIRKAEREGVAVCEVTSREDLDAYCALAGETTSRVRSVTAYTDFPSAFFQAVWARMVPEGTARMYLARRGVEPLAGCIILCGVGFGLYFAGASTRDRTLTALQGPTAVLWHAIQDLKRRGLVRFDFGGCTPTDDPGDPRYGVYAFKKRWGGVLESFSTLEVVLGPRRHALQERLLSPLWDRLQPFYFRLATRRAPSPRR